MKYREPLAALSLLLALALGTASCTTKDPDATAETPAAGEADPDVGEVEVPTAEQAEQQAAEQITPENADAEFDKLVDEIQGDDDN